MSSKDKNLNIIIKKIKNKKFIIPHFIVIKKNDLINIKKILSNIRNNFLNKKIILRSSSFLEDKLNKSNAGKYNSAIIHKYDEKKIIDKLNFISKKLTNKRDKIIIQELIYDTQTAGVIFSKDINNDSPYYIINYDNSGKTNLITSGKENASMNTLIVYNECKINHLFQKLVYIIKKFENLFKNSILDVEFAIKDNKIYIFQCRILKKSKSNNNLAISQSLINLEKKIIKFKKKNLYLSGKTTYFSNMSDWNPAEMLGIKPKPLGISLYKELITDTVWALQRKNYGYKDVSPNHLLINFAGSPYIDLRTDFNSFLPANLNKNIQEKLVNFFLKKINNNKSLHDKIEFEIIPTVYDADFNKKIKNVLTSNEKKQYLKSLKFLTNNILSKKNKILNLEERKIKKLEKKITQLNESKLSEIHKIFFLIQECKKNGTLPFAGLARCAFISNSIIKSFVSKKIISNKDKLNFYESFYNLSNSINKNLSNIRTKKNKNNFFDKFGHLRPLTYSIESKNYKENFEIYFKDLKKNIQVRRKKFLIDEKKHLKISKFFKENSIKINSRDFFDFAKKSTQLREESKLIFSKCINQIFDNLIKLGNEMSIERENLEYITIDNIMNSYSNLSNSKLKKIFTKQIEENKKNQKILHKIKLPDFIEDQHDIYIHKLMNINGNFVTEKNINGEVYEIKLIKKLIKPQNKIIFIENADPGYDFIFSHNIKGLVTKYGGPNSHMAIRCMELGLPAAIGIGENRYQKLINFNNIELNCNLKKIKIIN